MYLHFEALRFRRLSFGDNRVPKSRHASKNHLQFTTDLLGLINILMVSQVRYTFTLGKISVSRLKTEYRSSIGASAEVPNML